jgi:hypothetical protein
MRRTLILGALLPALVVVPAVAMAGSSGATSNSKTFADSTGEDVAAPDITGIALSNDDAGVITFRIAISNRPVLAQDMLVLIYVDSTQGAGDPESLGADYAIQLQPAGIALYKWNGSTYTFVSSSASFTYATSGPTIRLSAADLSGAKTINFVALAISGITIDAKATRTSAAPTPIPRPTRDTGRTATRC